MQEVLRDDDIAEYTLVVAIEAIQYQQSSPLNLMSSTYTSTVLAAIEIHTVSRSPEPPRYLRAMTVAY